MDVSTIAAPWKARQVGVTAALTSRCEADISKRAVTSTKATNAFVRDAVTFGVDDGNNESRGLTVDLSDIAAMVSISFRLRLRFILLFVLWRCQGCQLRGDMRWSIANEPVE